MDVSEKLLRPNRDPWSAIALSFRTTDRLTELSKLKHRVQLSDNVLEEYEEAAEP